MGCPKPPPPTDRWVEEPDKSSGAFGYGGRSPEWRAGVWGGVSLDPLRSESAQRNQ